MILHRRRCGKVGHRRLYIYKKKGLSSHGEPFFIDDLVAGAAGSSTVPCPSRAWGGLEARGTIRRPGAGRPWHDTKTRGGTPMARYEDQGLEAHGTIPRAIGIPGPSGPQRSPTNSPAHEKQIFDSQSRVYWVFFFLTAASLSVCSVFFREFLGVFVIIGLIINPNPGGISRERETERQSTITPSPVSSRLQ